MRATRVAATEKAALVGLVSGRARRLEAERSLDELAGLAEAAGAHVVLRVMQERPKPDPSTYLGAGKIDVLAASCAETSVDVVVFDAELTPAQLREIEKIVGRKVIDRTQLILDIFARRARTREGKLQVELAQLKYLLPRLVGASTALSRLGGGIGTRGPGETKLETDRRRIRTRIHTVSQDIEQVRLRRAQLRKRRHKASVPTVALVGYTNAGKTTLFNVLTRAGAEASDALFVTLDPLVRQVRLPDSRALLVSDTVGFIDRLPHRRCKSPANHAAAPGTNDWKRCGPLSPIDPRSPPRSARLGAQDMPVARFLRQGPLRIVITVPKTSQAPSRAIKPGRE
jgi:GTP-binding protein HflX